MPQFSVKLITYDPVIIEAFERLRKGRKLAAFTHEALKYFLTSDRGRKVIELMSNYNLSHLHLGHDIIKVELPKKPVPAEFDFPSEMATVSFSDVMENILK
jgi:hypothetical protein